MPNQLIASLLAHTLPILAANECACGVCVCACAYVFAKHLCEIIDNGIIIRIIFIIIAHFECSRQGFCHIADRKRQRKINKLVDLRRAKPAFMKMLKIIFQNCFCSSCCYCCCFKDCFVLQGTNQVNVLLTT